MLIPSPPPSRRMEGGGSCEPLQTSAKTSVLIHSPRYRRSPLSGPYDER